MKASCHLEIELEIDFDVQPSEPQTLHYPGCDAHLESIGISIVKNSGFALELPMEHSDAIMDLYGDEIEQVCWDHAREEEAADRVAYADHRRDLMEDR